MLNISNHMSSKWSQNQIQAAKELDGNIYDEQFPNIDPHMSSADLAEFINNFYQNIAPNFNDSWDNTGKKDRGIKTVLLQGEFTFVCGLIQKIRKERSDVKIFAATSERKVVETILPDGSTKKDAIFEFVQFREYPQF